MTDQPEPLDIVWGLENIAALIGRTVSQTQAALVKKELPGRQTNGRWAVSRKALERWFAGEDA